jgi:hypothetical protein
VRFANVLFCAMAFSFLSLCSKNSFVNLSLCRFLQ